MISNVTSPDAGHTALLVCVGHGLPDPEITWSFNGEPLANTSLTTIYEKAVPGREMFKQSILQLCSVNTSQAGRYTCSVTNGHKTDNATTRLIVSGITGNCLSTLQSQLMQVFAPTGDEVVEVVGITPYVILDEGDTMQIACLGYGDPGVTLDWSFNGSSLENSPLVRISEEEVFPGELTFKQSFLVLCDAGKYAGGNYTCTASNTRTTQLAEASTRLFLIR